MIIKAKVEWSTVVTIDVNKEDNIVDTKERVLLAAFEDLIHKQAQIVECVEMPKLIS